MTAGETRADGAGNDTAPLRVRLTMHESIGEIDAVAWNRLAGAQLFLRHEFLYAMERTGCVAPATGWAPRFLCIHRGARLAGAMPLYLKSHSYGEYVFDWAWADAFERSGLKYFPKLLCAVPFTPVGGPRLLAESDADRDLLIEGALALARTLGVSSLHLLYPQATDRPALARAGLMSRQGVQFHWQNRHAPVTDHAAGEAPTPNEGTRFTDFDAFLATMNHDKRKKVKQERRRVRDAGIVYRWKRGRDISEADWAFFYRCYADTYHRHGHRPYLSHEFFLQVADALPEHFVLILGERSDAGQVRAVACALDVHSADRVYGRYWGGLEFHSGLHFETCYYQSIEYCIAAGANAFEGGAQGEHKLARGLTPVVTHSAHWLAHPQFARAVEEYLARETRGIAHYVDELNEHVPFRSDLVRADPPPLT
ncbi:MAG: N-acetyltransferase, partial [Proteobacteria bacterium]|nr:N-acetyltransferase [Burkholderiales bacterium]